MPRSGEQARRRLQQAALELYRAQGYDRTTTAEIAARAGVTERTFFRHFADKREVLFDGEAVLRDILVTAVAKAPAELEPLATLAFAFRAAERLLEENRPFSVPRQAVIAAVPALKERELAKAASLIAALASALVQRGLPDRLATLAAQAGMAVFGQAVRAWLGDPSRTLDTHLASALDDLNALASTGSSEARLRG